MIRNHMPEFILPSVSEVTTSSTQVLFASLLHTDGTPIDQVEPVATTDQTIPDQNKHKAI